VQPTPVVQRVPLTIRHLANAANVTEALVRALVTVANHLERDVLQELHTAERISEPTSS